MKALISDELKKVIERSNYFEQSIKSHYDQLSNTTTNEKLFKAFIISNYKVGDIIRLSKYYCSEDIQREIIQLPKLNSSQSFLLKNVSTGEIYEFDFRNYYSLDI